MCKAAYLVSGHHKRMTQRPTRSLRHEYELYVEEEIENYKESVPRSVLLSIGDDAVSSLTREAQLTLTELLVWEEVDKIIFRRLRLPSYQTWRRRQLKVLEQLRRPEHWGLRADDALVRALQPGTGHVLVAGATSEASALYFAANGCDVTAIAPEAEALERVLRAAQQAGLSTRVHGQVGDLATWMPNTALTAVVVTPSALAGLSDEQRAKVIEVLQSATSDGGVHLVQAIAAGKRSSTIDELRTRYHGWLVSVERSDDRSTVFLARKEVS
jgi:hypothetical protein